MTFYSDAVEHAKRDYPRESCGFLVERGGEIHYAPVPNIAADPFNDWAIDGRDFATAEDVGTIVAVVHSHPDASSEPSPRDLDLFEFYGLRAVIIGLNRGAVEWRYVTGYQTLPDGI